MGQVASQERKSSSFQLSLLSHAVIESQGDVQAIGAMAVKIRKLKVSVPRPSKIFWVGVLLKRNGWIHTGVGLHNDITVDFGDGMTITYKYLVAHGVAGGDDDKFKVRLSFEDDLGSIYDSLAEAFETEVDRSLPPVFAGDLWTTNRIAEDIVKRIECFLGLPFNMISPSTGETNCVHFSVAMYLFFANKGESKLYSILGKVRPFIRDKNYSKLLRNIEFELNQVFPGDDDDDDDDETF